MHVIGTAGHVDHGKSALVQAITGIDPDRLAEEKRRGMTIDLGFAWAALPSGREVSIVDVPGHERFIKNMLAGVGGVDLALLVVAADESVMPQTREHLAILDLLGVRRGLAVITKADLADADMLEIAQLEVEEALAGTTLEGSPMVAVSAATGAGLPELLAAVDAALDETEPRRDVGRPRLSIDRAFAVAGFGAVVTGTLLDGALRVGQAVEIVPGGREARIRGLQTHRRKAESVAPGNRAAVNLSGVSAGEISRGQVLATPGWLRAVSAVDVRLTALADAPHGLRHNLPATFHAFAAESPAKLRLLDADALAPGEEGWAQIVLEQPVALTRGDRFVLRSADATLGGGTVVDVGAKRHRRRRAPVLDRLASLAEGGPSAQLLAALEGREPASPASLAGRANLSQEDAVALARSAVAAGTAVALGGGAVAADTSLYTAAGWARLRSNAVGALEEFHRRNPLREGMTREELRSRLRLRGNAAQATLDRLITDDAAVEAAGGEMRLPGHAVAVTAEQQAAMDAYVAALKRDPFPVEAPALAPELLALLAEQGRVVRASQGVVFDTATYARIEGEVTARLRSAGKVTVAEARDLLGTSRKYTLALLEEMDDRKVTRRAGDERTLLRE